ncbi:abhydrolase domain containing 17A, depalmitoylase [Homo sapiens]|uniref:Abhydrolase domain containing 17A, depalmitoylase n=1 Tax=Homo sapiens TaxID=9606 RepID=K7EQ25_HUMAN|nr:abhydrolase domain containing 17A, depalmitoylase [Homo sapiens]KAI4039401.1 abhydrolase domain containing 17A, depalmitoylase [Homo sapiens]
MNGLSLSELCCLFCCPPCPGRIAAKLAFLPPEATYSLVPEPEPGPGGAGAAPLGTLRASSGAPGRWKLHLTERADFQYSQRELDTIEVFPTKSARGNRVSCMYVRCVPGASFYIGLGSRLHCNIFSYDYSGYGASSGRPSERNLYADIDAAWQALRTRASARCPPWTWPRATSVPRWCCTRRSPRACASPSPTPRRPTASTPSLTSRRCPRSRLPCSSSTARRTR